MKNIVRAFVLVLAATGYVSFAHTTLTHQSLTGSKVLRSLPRPMPTPQPSV